MAAARTGRSAGKRATIRAAIAAGALVLVERPRYAYLEPAEAANRLATTDRLVELSLDGLRSRAKVGKLVDRLDFGNRSRANILTQQKSRLANLPGFPADLSALLEPIGRGTQQLAIAPARIRLFERSAGGRMDGITDRLAPRTERIS